MMTWQKLYCANVGDTRCVILKTDGTVERLSVDHKTNVKVERKFIKSRNGFVDSGRLNGHLAMSRAIGDGGLGTALNCTPDVAERDVDGIARVILACDGVWDVITDEEAFAVIAREPNPMIAAKLLRDAALEKQSEDNISVMVVNTRCFAGT
jgi:serine/threonine protein phosphatase PrpC